jgi:hypothetical protein
LGNAGWLLGDSLENFQKFSHAYAFIAMRCEHLNFPFKKLKAGNH